MSYLCDYWHRCIQFCYPKKFYFAVLWCTKNISIILCNDCIKKSYLAWFCSFVNTSTIQFGILKFNLFNKGIWLFKNLFKIIIYLALYIVNFYILLSKKSRIQMNINIFWLIRLVLKGLHTKCCMCSFYKRSFSTIMVSLSVLTRQLCICFVFKQNTGK